MKRKDNAEAIKNSQLSFFEKNGKEQAMETETETERKENGNEQKVNGNGNNIFFLDNGRIEPLSTDAFTASTLYQAVDSFIVECKLVKPEESGNISFEGKKPSKKTVPLLVKKDGECILLNSWEELESEPSRLANVQEVLGAMPVKQVFVLKRK